MKQQLALRVLAEAMNWSDDEANREFEWLKLISRVKYDGYQGYLAGVRFVESLIVWLQQFKETEERRTAYGFVRNRLIFINSQEMRHLVGRFYSQVVQPSLVAQAAEHFGIPRYTVWADEHAAARVKTLLRRTLFMGLSDGARMDILRRANAGRISNEQTVLAPIVDYEKWKDLQKELRNDLPGADEDPKFARVYVIDDLTASGTTLIRYDEESQKWKGKLPKLREAICQARTALGDEFPLAQNLALCVHHYIATESALRDVQKLCDQAAATFAETWWFSSVCLSASMVLKDSEKLRAADDPFVALTDVYYDPILENRHAKESGVTNMRLGYKECALPLILEHNTPNNSVSLLWAETEGQEEGAHAMRPLFRRTTRHT
ncbi:MAG: hypothetical protein U0326_06505 [Polyangiales bacterium]